MSHRIAMSAVATLFSIGCFGQNAAATNVFGYRLLQSLTVGSIYGQEEDEGWWFTYNEAGQCIKIVEGKSKNDADADIYTLDYVPGTIDGETYHVAFAWSFEENGALKYYSKMYLRLGENNFVEHCYQITEDYGEVSKDTWDFVYNSDGQLTTMRRSEGGNEVFEATYTDGDVTCSNMFTEETWKSYTSYTSDEVTTPIDNSDRIMMFEEWVMFDMDELGIIYFAGLLGNPTKHLPVAVSENGEVMNAFFWSASEDKKQTFMTCDDGSNMTKTTFTWSESLTGISTPSVDAHNHREIYNLNGIRLGKLQQGINIVNGKKIIK